jgi:hypothetical protein
MTVWNFWVYLNHLLWDSVTTSCSGWLTTTSSFTALSLLDNQQTAYYEFLYLGLVGWFMVFNVTFYNISVISWQSILLVEETAVPKENHWLVTSQLQTLSHNVVSSTLAWAGFKLTTLVVIGTDCTGSCKSNYNMITAMTAPLCLGE